MSFGSDSRKVGEQFFIGGDLEPINTSASQSSGKPSPWDEIVAASKPANLPASGGTPPQQGTQNASSAPRSGPTLEKLQELTLLYFQKYQEFEQNLTSADFNVTQADQAYMMRTMDYGVMQKKNIARVNFIQFVLREMDIWRSQLIQISQSVGAGDSTQVKDLLTQATLRLQQAISIWTDGLQKCTDAMKAVSSSIAGAQNIVNDVIGSIGNSTGTMISNYGQINSQFLDIFQS